MRTILPFILKFERRGKLHGDVLLKEHFRSVLPRMNAGSAEENH